MDITVFRSEKNGFLNYRTSEGNSFPLNILQDNIFKLPKDFIITNDKVDDYRIVYVPTTDGTTTYRLASAPIQNINRIGGGLSRATVINLIQQFGNGGTIGGSGTLNFIVKFTPDGTHIGDSQIYDNGTSVAIGTVAPSASAQFQMNSTTQGILTPRMTTAQRNAIVAPATGLLVYNSSISLFSYWDGAAWQNIDSTAGGDVSGSGTTNFITKWTDGPNSVIGDSLIRDDGTNTSINRTLVAGSVLSIQSNGTSITTYAIRLYNSTPSEIFSVYSTGHIYAGTPTLSNLFIGQDAGLVTTTAYDCTFVGKSAGAANTTGFQNTFIGTRCGILNTEGTENTAVGEDAFQANTVGDQNCAIGVSAMFSKTGNQNTACGGYSQNGSGTGIQNTSLGYQSMVGNGNGNYNVGIGANALQNGGGDYNTIVGTESMAVGPSTGERNTVIGAYCLRTNTAGSKNTAVGQGAGFSNNGNSNVFLGFAAGEWAVGSNELYINNVDRIDAAGDIALSLVYGKFAATTPSQFLRVNANLGILTNTFGTSADGVIGIKNGATEVSTSPADMIQIYSVDVNTAVTPLASLGLRTEQPVEALGLSVADSKLRVKLNGTEYFILLDTA